MRNLINAFHAKSIESSAANKSSAAIKSSGESTSQKPANSMQASADMPSAFLARIREISGQEPVLLAANQKKLSAHSVANLSDLTLDREGANRRTIGLLPMPEKIQNHELTTTETLRLQKFLLSIEGRQQSCCIRVISNETKSRSALLVYRGRLIGSVSGRKGREEQMYGKPALKDVLDDLSSTNNVVDAYPLDDEMVLAAASLFHGGLKQVFKGGSASRVAANCAQMLVRNERTGCVVVKLQDGSAVCVAYIFEGRIVGVYSFADGWLTKTHTAFLNCLDFVSSADVLISMLPVDCDKAMVLTESLSGLGIA